MINLCFSMFNRAYNISRRAPWVLWTLLTLFSLLTAVRRHIDIFWVSFIELCRFVQAEIFTNVFARIRESFRIVLP